MRPGGQDAATSGTSCAHHPADVVRAVAVDPPQEGIDGDVARLLLDDGRDFRTSVDAEPAGPEHGVASAGARVPREHGAWRAVYFGSTSSFVDRMFPEATS